MAETRPPIPNSSALFLAGCGILSLGYTIWKQINEGNNFGRQRKNATSSASLTAHEYLIEMGTPLVPLRQISKLVGRNIYVKMESLNPGGTGKDRAAINMIRSAERNNLLPQPNDAGDLFLLTTPAEAPETQSEVDGTASMTGDDKNDSQKSNHQSQSSQSAPSLESMIVQAMAKSRTGGLVVEGTSGSTGIALATICAARGHACLVVLPDDQAQEKKAILQSLGAIVYEVPTASISNPNHYVNIARQAAKLARRKFGIRAFFVDQFENPANYQMHYDNTGPEIWQQLPTIDAFCMSSGTGGTIAGVGTYLKEKQSKVKIMLVDPPGSSLYNKVEHGIAYAVQQSERSVRKHRYDTLAEGIGLDRVTQNFDWGLDAMDGAIRVSDQEAVDMAHYLLKLEGLWVGSSSAMNVVGAIRTAIDMPEGSNVVTMICDGGQRHATRFWNPAFIEKNRGLIWPWEERIPECLQQMAVS
ncbi:unnamed protein product [Cylindrotheca closterium]|uniref:Tryptophan synthase beta chain-like PALP domain-containing protein n=1 Tax=Cylindrotheca closterium TaxID=2856 RepID=A0AAD2FR07_9STRA|nr:unnamed protein product [Cylindrotheca closterium]